ncbi:hypothetical protein C8R46DRAFT_552075 [Mycena filopes]|nr:hypothetical protein C8R46DRAFT_552075 [Mycena filopes]
MSDTIFRHYQHPAEPPPTSGLVDPPQKRGRGRPKGSKNKRKVEDLEPQASNNDPGDLPLTLEASQQPQKRTKTRSDDVQRLASIHFTDGTDRTGPTQGHSDLLAGGSRSQTRVEMPTTTLTDPNTSSTPPTLPPITHNSSSPAAPVMHDATPLVPRGPSRSVVARANADPSTNIPASASSLPTTSSPPLAGTASIQSVPMY